MQPQGKNLSNTAQLLKMMDEDKDGTLSQKEVKGPLAKDFSSIDTDQNGFLTVEELEKAPKPKKGHYGPRKERQPK